jgi:hypothetical protein
MKSRYSIEHKRKLWCAHCHRSFAWYNYTDHVKLCLRSTIECWDFEAYSERYMEQVRAMSRFRRPGDPKRRSPFKSWAWWRAVKEIINAAP